MPQRIRPAISICRRSLLGMFSFMAFFSLALHIFPSPTVSLVSFIVALQPCQPYGPSGLTGRDVFPPFLQARFFVYFLRKHMKLAFHPQFFQTNFMVMWIDNDWDAFHQSLLIFSLDDVEGREKYYPDCAASQQFPDDGFLDGVDLLVSSDKLQEIAVSSSETFPNMG
ncbi:hypothetical protein VHEMI10597 [[Torrubiella] hemipterigena]|uniref:Uncharacterized protein n=1 Tax=[Torrubiella] hemipterigena TaxID=1531966 RepID=A0A0A1TS46_9HYPO|nr:hypothetical protein VHEMI10597 [[Torrubiella] hemipterigena]